MPPSHPSIMTMFRTLLALPALLIAALLIVLMGRYPVLDEAAESSSAKA